MDIIDNIGKKATDTCKSAAKQTSKFVEIAKLKLFISKSRDEIEDIYAEIGKKIYERHVENKEIKDNRFYIQDCIEIDSIASEIEEARIKILELSGSKQCKSCYSEVEEEFKFCPKCGSEFAKQKEEKHHCGCGNIKHECDCDASKDEEPPIC